MKEENKTKQPNIYLIGDTHFGHSNMIPYCGQPENFDEVIVSNWNKLVQSDDIVIHLGDVIMGAEASERLLPIMKQLHGKKILCRGNHDVEKKWGTGVEFMERGFDFVCDYFIYDRYAFSHCPLTPLPKQANGNWKEDVLCCFHAHFHNSPPTNIQNANTERDLFDHKYYFENEKKYQLIQIEDTLRPFSLEEAIGMWLSKGADGLPITEAGRAAKP